MNGKGKSRTLIDNGPPQSTHNGMPQGDMPTDCAKDEPILDSRNNVSSRSIVEEKSEGSFKEHPRKCNRKGRPRQARVIAMDDSEAPLPRPFEIDQKEFFTDYTEEMERETAFFGPSNFNNGNESLPLLTGGDPVFQPKPRTKASTSGWARLFRYDPFLSVLFGAIEAAGIKIPSPKGYLDECIGYEVDWIRLVYQPYRQPDPFGKMSGLRPRPAPIEEGASGFYGYGIPRAEEDEFPPPKSQKSGEKLSSTSNEPIYRKLKELEARVAELKKELDYWKSIALGYPKPLNGLPSGAGYRDHSKGLANKSHNSEASSEGNCEPLRPHNIRIIVHPPPEDGLEKYRSWLSTCTK